MVLRRRYVALVATTAVALLLVSCSSSKNNSGATTSSASSSGGSSSAPATGSSANSSFPAIPAGTIHLCGSYPISGANAAYGSTAKEGAAIDQDLINNTFGGIDGHKVEVDIADDQSSATTAVSIANKYASQHATDPLQCPLVYQLSQDPTTAPLQAAIFNKAKIAMLATQSPDQFFDATKFPEFFSISPSDAALGQAAAHYLIANKLTKIGVLTNAIPQEAEYIADIKSAATAQGGNLDFIKTVQLGIGAVDAKTQLQQLKDANPDVVLVATEFGFGPIWQSFQSIGWSPKIMGDVGFFYDGYNSLKGLAAGAAAPCWWGQVTGQTLPQSLVDVINKIAPLNGGFAPDPIIAGSVSAAQMLLAKYSIEKYHSVDPAAIEQALSAMTNANPMPSFWDGLNFTFSGATRSGLVGPYGAGICEAAPLGVVGNNFKTFVYADSYRATA